MTIIIIMTSTTYQVDTPRWLWQLFKRAIDDADYDKYNDRLVEAIAVDVRRFDEAGLLELDDGEQARIDQVLADVAVDDDTVPSQTEGVGHSEARRGPSSGRDPRGETSR